MSNSLSLFGSIAAHFGLLSLLSFGGVAPVIPEIHRQAVDVSHWMSDKQFADAFAISQAVPGPNVLIVTLVGWQAAGLAGALLATVAMCAPAATLAYCGAGVWHRFSNSPWRKIVHNGLAPITVGLIAASALILCRAADRSLPLTIITAATAVFACCSKRNPLWAFGVAGALGMAGLV